MNVKWNVTFSCEIFDREPVKIVKHEEQASNASEQACFVFGNDVEIVNPFFQIPALIAAIRSNMRKQKKKKLRVW
jgi:hypothetical protein